MKVTNFLLILRKQIILFLNLIGRLLLLTFLPALVHKLLEQKKTIKFLGVYIDEHLTWKDHISYISKKISKSVGIMHRSRFNLSSKTKLSLYYTLIYPYIIYCNLAWSSTYILQIVPIDSSFNRLFIELLFAT